MQQVKDWCKCNKLYIYWTLGVALAIVLVDTLLLKGRGRQKLINLVKGK